MTTFQRQSIKERGHFSNLPALFPVIKMTIDSKGISVKRRFLNQVDYPRFYGKIPDNLSNSEKLIENIDGMSGGPIFGVKKDKYWIIALQSGWFKTFRIITACPVQNFVEWFDSELEKVIDNL